MGQTNRSATLDITKGIGIILVVVGHSWLVLNQPGLFFQIIYSFHVPLFFFLSGMFVKENISSINFVFRKAESLLKPYLVVSLFILLFSWTKAYFMAGSFTYDKGFIEIFYASGDKIISTPTWFLPSLFITLVALLPLTKTNIKLKVFSLLSLLIVSAFFNGIHETIISLMTVKGSNINYLPWSVDLLPITLFFALAGFMFKDHFLRFSPNFALVGLTLLIYVITLSLIQTPALNLHIRYFGAPFYSLALAFSGIYLIITISYYLARYKKIASFLNIIGKNTLFILLFHGITLNFLTRNFDKIFDYLPFSSFLGIAFSIIIPIYLFRYTQKNKLLSSLLLPTK